MKHVSERAPKLCFSWEHAHGRFAEALAQLTRPTNQGRGKEALILAKVPHAK